MTTFNIAFLADTHIDYSYGIKTDATGLNLRALDGFMAFERIVEDIIDHRAEIDIVLIAGDLFHTSHPSILAIMRVQELMRRLSRAGLKVYILAGNHDVTDNRTYPAAVGVINDPERGIFAHFEPYAIEEVGPGVLLHMVSHHGLHGDDIPELKPNSSDLNIYTAHGAAVDPTNDGLMRCMDSPREQIITPEVILDPNFNVRLLGHFHSRVAVGGSPELKTWYAGSILRRGFSDDPGARGWMLVKMDTNGNIQMENHDIPQRPQFDFTPIDAEGLTASDINDIILGNIDNSREDVTTTFDNARAPILRQTVLNVPLSIRNGLDRAEYNKRAGHALKWLLNLKKPEQSETLAGVDEEPPKEHSISLSIDRPNTDIIASYKNWVDDSETLRQLHSDHRVPVKDGAQVHLKRVEDAQSN